MEPVSHDPFEKDLEALAKQAGVPPYSRETHLGAAADLWKDDAEFDEFLAAIEASKKEPDQKDTQTGAA